MKGNIHYMVKSRFKGGDKVLYPDMVTGEMKEGLIDQDLTVLPQPHEAGGFVLTGQPVYKYSIVGVPGIFLEEHLKSLNDE